MTLWRLYTHKGLPSKPIGPKRRLYPAEELMEWVRENSPKKEVQAGLRLNLLWEQDKRRLLAGILAQAAMVHPYMPDSLLQAFRLGESLMFSGGRGHEELPDTVFAEANHRKQRMLKWLDGGRLPGQSLGQLVGATDDFTQDSMILSSLLDEFDDE